MGLVRRPWSWKDPTTGKRHEIWHSRDLVAVLENVIDDEEQADDFLAEYEKICPYAEYNIAYHILLISDPDVREDALDLFMINPKDHMTDGVIAPRHTFETHRGGSSLGVKVDLDEIKRNRKPVKAGRK